MGLSNDARSLFLSQMCIFISAVCDMFKSMTKLASNVTYSDKLFIEWNNVFAAETHTIISYNWKNLAGRWTDEGTDSFS